MQNWPTLIRIRLLMALLIVVCCGSISMGQLDFEAPPIDYHKTPVSDVVFQLQAKIDNGDLSLEHDQRRGYLAALLKSLDIPISSQLLVFSKTSLQIQRISRRRPRAVYYNDDVYVGWIPGSDVMEISVADPNQGAVFYTLRQQPSQPVKFVRDRGQCLSCHASSRTSGVPGHLMRSVYADHRGQPFFGAGTFTTDDRSPLHERWGGWFVTGSHGKLRHMGNVVATDRDRTDELDVEAGANVTDLKKFVDVKPYLSPHSDIVSLMVLGHQARMHNLITRANFETRLAHHYDAIMNKALGRPDDFQSDSTRRRIDSAADRVVAGLLFSDEAALTDAIRGTSDFAAEFAAKGPRDKQGRSLRQFDLERRLMKYPCSYLIYSDSFSCLPKDAKQAIYAKLYSVLKGELQDEKYDHLSGEDRQAVFEILSETMEDLPGSWQ